MKNKKLKKLVVTTLAATLAINTGSTLKAETVDMQGTSKLTEEPVLIPKPTKVTYKEGSLNLTSSVNVKGQDIADEDAITELKAFLKDNDITLNTSYQEDATTILLAEADDESADVKEAEAKLGIESATTLKDEGYVLGVDYDAKGGTVVIEGKDGDGTFYGVQTLKQLSVKADETLSVKRAAITDEPSMKTRGIIEGFYGSPWTHQDRLDQLDFYGRMKLNTYIYAPKDDPYHREKWRDPYPTSEMTRMNELISKSMDSKVDFVFALSPGNDVKFDGATAEADFQALVTKCESLYNMGVRSFAIFFDDISNKQGEKQAAFLNRFNKEFVKAKKDVKPLITVPTEYDTLAMSVGNDIKDYTREFSQTLDEDIKVLWTGSAVVPEGIDVTNAQFVKSIYGNRIGIWWNYPVTDYITPKLGLGPIYNLDKGLQNELDFFTMNPMEHAELSEISLATGADYSWNMSAYDYEASFDNAIKTLYGELAPFMKTFANHSTRLEAGWASTGRADAPEVKAMMDTLIKKLAKGQDATAEITYLTTEFDAMILAADTLKTSFTAAQLSHCSGNLNKLKALGENDKLALQLIVAKCNSDAAETTRLTKLLKAVLPSLKSGSRVSDKTALAFISDVLDYDPNPTAGFTVSSTFVAPGQAVEFKNASSVSSAELEWTFKGANKEVSTEENPVVKYAKEGIYPVTLKAKNALGVNEVVKEGLITVSNEAKNETMNVSVGKTATASGYTSAGEAPVKAIDGISTTKWCATGNRVHTLTIDLGAIQTISSVTILHAEKGGEGSALNTKAYRVEVSADGVNYSEKLRVTNNTAGVTSDALPVSLARYVRLLVDAPTQGGDSAARIYEVEVMGLNKEITMPPVYKEDTTLMRSIIATTIAKVDSAIENGQLDNVVAIVAANIRARLAEAKTVAADENATNAQLFEAWLNLADAIQYLDFTADKSVLSVLIETCDKINENINDYESGVEAFQTALAAAKVVYNNENALQASIEAAVTNLETARDGLVKKEVNKALLADVIAGIEAKIGDGSKYKKDEAWDIFQAALTKAKAIIANENATQTEVNTSFTDLTEAYTKIRLIPDEALLANLKNFIQMMNGVVANRYSAQNYKVMMDTKAKAEALLNDFNEETYYAVEVDMVHALDLMKNAQIDNTNNIDTSDNTKQNEVKNPALNGVNTSDSTNVAGLFALVLGGAVLCIISKRKREVE